MTEDSEFTTDQLIEATRLLWMGKRDWIERAEAGAFKTTADNIALTRHRMKQLAAIAEKLKTLKEIEDGQNAG